MAEDVTHIIIHCAATPPDMNIGARDIDKWHKERGWSGCGYHAVIRRDGTLQGAEDGCRRMDRVGAHCHGYNRRSVGVCLVGGVDEAGEPENNFTPEQFVTLGRVVVDLQRKFPGAVVCGHRDIPGVTKACPSFDVAEWLAESAAGEVA